MMTYGGNDDFARSDTIAQHVVLATPPSFTVANFRNAASFTQRLAPGTITSLFAINLALRVARATTLPLPLMLENVEIRVNGTPVPFYFVAPEQANFLIPFDMAREIDVIASNRGVAGAPVRVTLEAVAPAIFTLTQDGGGQAAALVAGTDLIAGEYAGAPSRRVRRGEVVELYATGLGPVTNAPPVGSGGPNSPLAETVSRPNVQIGGVEAEVLFSGLAPGLAGVDQVNARVPVGAPSGAAVALTLEIQGVQSQDGVIVGVE